MKLEAARGVLATLVLTVVVVVGVGGQQEEHHPNTTTTTSTTTEPPMSCEEARIKCYLRKNCRMALHNYMLACADLMAGRSSHCDQYCKHTLIALTSAHEGHALMDCVCSDDYCRETKGHVEVCREEVLLAQAATTVVSCSLAQWICAADTLCSTAITYYERYCRKMFAGKGCSYRCNNSISILQRQTAAAKLETCECDGSESFDCPGIKGNMARLCFHQYDERELEREEEQTNQVETRAAAASKASLSAAASPSLLRASPGSLFFSSHLLCPATFLLLHLLVSAVVRW